MLAEDIRKGFRSIRYDLPVSVGQNKPRGGSNVPSSSIGPRPFGRGGARSTSSRFSCQFCASDKHLTFDCTSSVSKYSSIHINSSTHLNYEGYHSLNSIVVF